MRALPKAYAFSLWLRDIGCNDEQIASVLAIEPEFVSELLERASARQGITRDASKVAVFTRSSDRVIHAASVFAKRSDSLLHVVELTGDNVDHDENVQGALLRAGRRALLSSDDVAPHAIEGDAAKALLILNATSVVSTVVIGAEDPRCAVLERAARDAGARPLIIERAIDGAQRESVHPVAREETAARGLGPLGRRRASTACVALMTTLFISALTLPTVAAQEGTARFGIRPVSAGETTLEAMLGRSSTRSPARCVGR